MCKTSQPTDKSVSSLVFGTKLKDVFGISLSCTSHQPVAFCLFSESYLFPSSLLFQYDSDNHITLVVIVKMHLSLPDLGVSPPDLGVSPPDLGEGEGKCFRSRSRSRLLDS